MVTKEQLMDDYRKINNKKKFIDFVSKKHKMKYTSALRRFYDIKKLVEEEIKETLLQKIEPKEHKEEIHDYLVESEPHKLKKLIVDDMIRLKYKLTKIILRTYGLNNEEILWLKHRGYKISDD